MQRDGERIRVVLVEDSPVQMAVLESVLEDCDGFTVVGMAVNGTQGITLTERLRPDVVLMDFQLPDMDGVTATRMIMERCPTPIVIATASVIQEDVRLTFDAIKSGALAVVNKPTAPGTREHEQTLDRLLRTLRLMSEVKVVRRFPDRVHDALDTGWHRNTADAPPARMVALAGSTGAPPVIVDILTAIGPRSGAPVIIVQHLVEGFAEGFASWLQHKSGVVVQMAQDGLQMEAGRAYLAPDFVHTGVDKAGHIVLSSNAPDDGFRPSANHLFASVARSFGPASMGILLTGMGRDGAAGLLEVQHSGGLTVAQSEESCVVFGMPREAIRLGAVTHVLDPTEIGPMLLACTEPDAQSGNGDSRESARA